MQCSTVLSSFCAVWLFNLRMKGPKLCFEFPTCQFVTSNSNQQSKCMLTYSSTTRLENREGVGEHVVEGVWLILHVKKKIKKDTIKSLRCLFHVNGGWLIGIGGVINKRSTHSLKRACISVSIQAASPVSANHVCFGEMEEKSSGSSGFRMDGCLEWSPSLDSNCTAAPGNGRCPVGQWTVTS